MPHTPRLYTTDPIEKSIVIGLDEKQSHYLINVMRCGSGDKVIIFNGKDGQWNTEISRITKKSVSVIAQTQTRPQKASPDLWLVFAPIKNKTELLVEKATELGISKILTVITKHSVVRSVNMEKLEAHAIEAAEQCERLDVPTIENCKDISHLLGNWSKDRILLYGDETGGGTNLQKLLSVSDKNKKYAVLIGSEGGFSKDELDMLKVCDFAKGIGMGGRIMRAETAAIAALACVQANFGDWDEKPHFVSNYSDKQL